MTIAVDQDVKHLTKQNKLEKGEFQIYPRMDFDDILYVEYLRYNNYKIKIISCLEGHRGTFMYTLFVLIYDLFNISLKSLTLLTATFFEGDMKEDSPGYTLLPLIYMNISRYFF